MSARQGADSGVQQNDDSPAKLFIERQLTGGQAMLSGYHGFAGADDPQIPPGVPPETPQPDLPPDIAPQGPPETTPEPPPEVQPGQPVEVPSQAPPET
jgi:hypothetical protein